MISKDFEGKTGIVLGTGPSLSASLDEINDVASRGVPVFGVNNTYLDVPQQAVMCATDEAWWHRFGHDEQLKRHPCRKYCWSEAVARTFPYVHHIPGKWADGLSLDPRVIHYGHSSSYQALNLAVLMGCNKILLCGFDMRYAAGQPRHYFYGLSNERGEYPGALRKYSTFDGLLKCYEQIARQHGLPPILNCTAGSALQCFPFSELANEL